MKIFQWLLDNYVNLLVAVAALVAFAEIVVRFTKTKKDDGAVQRIGKILKAIMDFLKIPNRLK